ncbi:MAG: hypothetical protein GWN00_06430 [Aliifodinibius sp.]|nr:hypothetical protein [Fodinibius sp.]NIV10855.1 hypothetical protein [Fodinibius sp.]NIY24452.1 hypothetical protein [Fodinibius sp.]
MPKEKRSKKYYFAVTLRVSYVWDGIKDDGSEAEAGVYSYRILSGDRELGTGTFLLR